MLEGGPEPGVLERLQYVVDRMDLKCIDGVAIERRHEYHGGHLVGADLPHHAETIESRHLDIEEHQVGVEAFDQRHGIEPIGALSDQLEFRVGGQELLSFLALRAVELAVGVGHQLHHVFGGETHDSSSESTCRLVSSGAPLAEASESGTGPICST